MSTRWPTGNSSSILGFCRLASAAVSVLSGLGACASGTPAPSAPAAPGSPTAPSSAREPLPADIVERSALPLHALAGETRLAEPTLWDQMAGYRVVCFGEQHDSPQHHYAQRRAIEELAARNDGGRRLGVGLEMFQKPYQPALSGFVQGSIDEAAFLVQSEWSERWGFDFALYRPLLEVARERRLDALALNAPRELTRKISRSGLASLDATERANVPELVLDDAAHRAYFDHAMSGHPMPASGPKMDNMYAVQVVWDETMADTAARWLASAGPDSRLLIIAGSGHCHRRAIPARLARRVGVPVLSLSGILESELGERGESGGEYDWWLVLEDGASKGAG
jgi:uncharacterized iron-regulated protein